MSGKARYWRMPREYWEAMQGLPVSAKLDFIEQLMAMAFDGEELDVSSKTARQAAAVPLLYLRKYRDRRVSGESVGEAEAKAEAKDKVESPDSPMICADESAEDCRRDDLKNSKIDKWSDAINEEWVAHYEQATGTAYTPSFRFGSHSDAVASLAQQIEAKLTAGGWNPSNRREFLRELFAKAWAVADDFQRRRWSLEYFEKNFNQIFSNIRNGRKKDTERNGHNRAVENSDYLRELSKRLASD